MRGLLRNSQGFTLLEVIVAFSILTIVLLSAYIAQSSGIISTSRAENTLIAANLARTMLEKSEVELGNKEFQLLKEEEEGEFKDPYETFKWKREIKEVDFTALAKVIVAAIAAEQEESPEEAQNLVMQIFLNYLKDSVRMMKITIIWEEDGKIQEEEFSTFLVRYDAEFRTSI